MPTTLETFTKKILQPAQCAEDARQDAIRIAASQTIASGQAIAIKTADGLGYPMVPGNSDGTQNFVGFSMYDIITDASQNVFFSDSSTASTLNTSQQTAPMWVNGIFDPADLKTKATPVAQVDTYTPAGTIATGDINTIRYTAPDGTVTNIAFTVAGTTTAAAVSAGLIAAWNANATTAAVATASGSSTVILTGKVAGTPFTTVNPAGTATTGTASGTLTRAATTAASGRAIADVQVARPGACVLHNGFWKV